MIQVTNTNDDSTEQDHTGWTHSVLYRHSTVLYCTVLYCTVLYSTVQLVHSLLPVRNQVPRLWGQLTEQGGRKLPASQPRVVSDRGCWPSARQGFSASSRGRGDMGPWAGFLAAPHS